MASPTSFRASFLMILLSTAAVVPNWVQGNAEMEALSAFRQSLSDPNHVLDSWDPSLRDPCSWFHITCDRDNRVMRLDLGGDDLSGHLVPNLGKLEHLQHLNLYTNKLEGTIPPELGNLKNLVSLSLFENNLSGHIPPSLGNLKSLVILRLNHNKLRGSIPTELTRISGLRIVNLSSNDLCGHTPTNGSFAGLPPESFADNPRLGGPESTGPLELRYRL